MSLLVGIDSLPEEVQRSLNRYTHEKGTQEFLQSLDRFLGNHVLDEFLEVSPTFRYPAAEIFGEHHLYLKQMALGMHP